MASIFAAIEFIRRFPDAAEATRLPGIRAKVVPRYRYKIFYRIFLAEETVQILHVRHTSREPWDQWEKEE